MLSVRRFVHTLLSGVELDCVFVEFDVYAFLRTVRQTVALRMLDLVETRISSLRTVEVDTVQKCAG